MDKRLTSGIAVVITAAWSISFVADMAMSTYEPPATVHGLMMLVAGSVFAAPIIRPNKEPATDDS